MSRFSRFALLVGTGTFLALSTGCATILGGGGQEAVVISSNTPGHHIEILNKKGEVVSNGATPLTVTLNRGDGFFSQSKYVVRDTDANPPREVPIKGGLNPWYLGNLFFGGLPGIFVVDPLTGAMWDFPKEFNIDGPQAKAIAPENHASLDAAHSPYGMVQATGSMDRQQ